MPKPVRKGPRKKPTVTGGPLLPNPTALVRELLRPASPRGIGTLGRASGAAAAPFGSIRKKK